MTHACDQINDESCFQREYQSISFVFQADLAVVAAAVDSEAVEVVVVVAASAQNGGKRPSIFIGLRISQFNTFSETFFYAYKTRFNTIYLNDTESYKFLRDM